MPSMFSQLLQGPGEIESSQYFVRYPELAFLDQPYRAAYGLIIDVSVLRYRIVA